MKYPFIYGAQYYRAPTPDRKYWRDDLKRMADCGFNAVKFWCQWRWVHRAREAFYFEDLDQLMDLAGEQGLAVTINVIFDVAPSWLFQAYPDCLMVTASGRPVQPCATAYRQIGGYPGPCFNHAEARAARQEFLRQAVSRFVGHPAMRMWDIWNEPESCATLRDPHETTLLCYCRNCERRFRDWLSARYGQIERLNEVWGRCYGDWTDIELPRRRDTFTDMIDWRLFNLDTLAAEARWRIETVKAMDASHPVYLHPVPGIMSAFNAVTCVDDFQIADGCDCFGGSSNGVPASIIQTVASARGRISYNAECHLRAGSTFMYPRPLTLRDFTDNLIPQIGLGIRGFLHWQYRAETLGSESPAWGLLDVDGRPGTTHEAAVLFWQKLKPVADKLISAPVEPAETAIFRSNTNEIFEWCMCGSLGRLNASLTEYARLLYEKNVRTTIIDDRMLAAGLPQSIKLLIMPSSYALTQEVADALASWVRAGGTLVCEAHTGGYNLSTGRHSEHLPGLGLSDAFGLRECNATSVHHLDFCNRGELHYHLPPDLAKAAAAFGWEGGADVSLTLECGRTLQGWFRYAELEAENLEPICVFPGRKPCIARTRVGSGNVYYIGTLAGRPVGAGFGIRAQQEGGLAWLIDEALRSADVEPSSVRWPGVPDGVRVDVLRSLDGTAFALTNRTKAAVEVALVRTEPACGLYTGQTTEDSGDKLRLEAKQAELLVPVRWTKGARREM
ncbi:MAG: beta-galactosidase [Armatimonadetes bacterium]|nr:beta-galactosidase [Armatimonadota bacterium]